jgi:hypothetical protein
MASGPQPGDAICDWMLCCKPAPIWGSEAGSAQQRQLKTRAVNVAFKQDSHFQAKRLVANWYVRYEDNILEMLSEALANWNLGP